MPYSFSNWTAPDEFWRSLYFCKMSSFLVVLSDFILLELIRIESPVVVIFGYFLTKPNFVTFNCRGEGLIDCRGVLRLFVLHLSKLLTFKLGRKLLVFYRQVWYEL